MVSIYTKLPHGIDLFDVPVVMSLFFAITFQQKSLWPIMAAVLSRSSYCSMMSA
jgi:hypothetical protein